MNKISIIMPAYMEVKNIAAAVESTLWAVQAAGLADYEILIVTCTRPDGTHDGTPDIAKRLAEGNPHIRFFPTSYGNLGQKFWIGVDKARFPFVVMVASDNEIGREAIRDVLTRAGAADIVTSYAANMEVRPLMRQIISRTFTMLMNIISGRRLKYYNGMCLHRVELLKSVPTRNTSFAYMAEVLTHLLSKGHSFYEVPILLQERQGGKSAAFKLNNIVEVCKTLGKLFWKYRILRGR